MSKITENVISTPDENYPSYGSVVISVRDTDTGEVKTGTANYSPYGGNSEAEAIAEAIEQASNKF